MTAHRRLGARNRGLTGLAGLALLLAGGWLALSGAVTRGLLEWNLPSWWPTPPRTPRSLGTRLDGVLSSGWWTPVMAAVAVLVLLGLLRLLWTQTGPRTPRVLAMWPGHVRMRSRALTSAVRAEAEAVPGVSRASVRLPGRRHGRGARLALTVRLEPWTEPGATVRALSSVVANARTATGRPELPATVRLRPTTRNARVR